MVANFHVVIVYDCLDILHIAAVTHFNFISIENLDKGVLFGGMGIC